MTGSKGTYVRRKSYFKDGYFKDEKAISKTKKAISKTKKLFKKRKKLFLRRKKEEQKSFFIEQER